VKAISRRERAASGVALIIVMVVITVLSILAGGFAFSMKVETRLANNGGQEPGMDWLGRSGVELARYVLAMQANLTPGFDALNQKWAGGTGETNDILAAISLEDNPLGQGRFSVRIVDQERKLNINMANEEIIQQALLNLGADPRESGGIADCLKDWLDKDDHPHLIGAESDDYLSNPNPGFLPYFAKNGAIDDPVELLMVRGITPELYFGAGAGVSASSISGIGNVRRAGQPVVSGSGFRELFVAVSGPQVNVNTAPVEVLQTIPGIAPDVAAGIVQTRAGFDGVDGNEDDLPFRNVGELINVPGVTRGMVGQMQRFFNVRSMTFEVRVQVEVGSYRKTYIALLRRLGGRDVQIAYMHPE
jgi:general secretion pathway protein K